MSFSFHVHMLSVKNEYASYYCEYGNGDTWNGKLHHTRPWGRAIICLALPLDAYLGLEMLTRLSPTVCCSRENYKQKHQYRPPWHKLCLHPLSDKIQAGLGVSTSCLRNAPTSNQIANELIDFIYSIVKPFRSEIQTLALYTYKPLPLPEDSYRSLKYCGKMDMPWTNLIEAATRFNDLRCEQLLGTYMQPHTLVSDERSPDTGYWNGTVFDFALNCPALFCDRSVVSSESSC